MQRASLVVAGLAALVLQVSDAGAQTGGRRPGPDAAAAFRQGTAQLEAKRVGEAVDWLEKAVELAPANARYHLKLAAAYGAAAQEASVLRQAGLARKVKSELERAARLDPSLVEARVGLIRYHLRAPGIMGGDKEEAERQAEVVARLDPWKGWRWLSTVYRALNRPADEQRVLLEATRTFPDSAGPAYRLGELNERLGRTELAREWYRRALAVEPAFEAAEKALASLKRG